MEHTLATWLPQAAAAAGEQGVSSHLFRVVLIVMLVGCVLGAWLLLRGYRGDDD
ncbi:hypothetical protein [Streptomyces poonensis]|uniref:Uncharacterized protein n=1 Tax=Streptomyces poonensis TaxID=68255 RepID=A0A918PPJ1_9ACTN|nr:hypothetical protein [Streptomyces poonensis]GGZ18525.1 hypothetical protein GCM10010365_43440 [Streptomyces poonensis]GLJ90604.1 hypothetical protein GCM10017589_32090 [Streptomyces poonensis]